MQMGRNQKDKAKGNVVEQVNKKKRTRMQRDADIATMAPDTNGQPQRGNRIG